MFLSPSLPLSLSFRGEIFAHSISVLNWAFFRDAAFALFLFKTQHIEEVVGGGVLDFQE